MESRYIIVAFSMNMVAILDEYKTDVPQIKNIEVIFSTNSVSVTYTYRTKYRNNLLKLRLENG